MVVYLGDDFWYCVIGGDGMCIVIDQEDNSCVYGFFQWLNICQSFNGGLDFGLLFISSLGNEVINFNGFFIFVFQNLVIIYVGVQCLY